MSRMVWVRRSEGSWPALKARDLSRPRMYMLNSLRFSGRTSWPGGWEPEKDLRYPARMSTVFSVRASRRDFRGRSVIRDAAGNSGQWGKNGGNWEGDLHTFFGYDVDDGVLVDVTHSFDCSLADAGYSVCTSYSSFSTSCGV